MGSTMNLVMTSFGFVVSAIFIVFVLARLLCARLRTRNLRARWPFGVAFDSIAQIERGANGMDLGAVSLFPTIKYNQDVFASIEDATCTICLIGYEDREILRILPQCGHAFHLKCIDAWLLQQSTCPICRLHLQSSPLRRNMSSPLLSMAARSRFSPGAIPDNLFVHPLLSSPPSTLGGQSPYECDTCDSLQGCDCSTEAQQVPRVPGAHVFIDLQRSVHSNSKSCNFDLERKRFGEGAASPGDDNLRDSRPSISEHGTELEQQRSSGLGSCYCHREESKQNVGPGAIIDGKCEELDGRDAASSIIAEERGGRGCFSVEEAEKWIVVSDLGMQSQSGVDEASGRLYKQKSVKKDWRDFLIDGNNSSLEDKENGCQERHSFSSWIGKVQGECTQQTSTQRVTKRSVEAETEDRSEDVNLGWSPITFHLSPGDESEARFQLDASTHHRNYEKKDVQ